jgi:predicted nucleotidyltransferase
MNENEWVLIEKKQRKKKSQQNKTNNLDLNNLIQIILYVLTKYDPYAIYIYGSRARGTNRIDSDVDILVFWKRSNKNINKLINIKEELILNLKIDVDFINMILINKFVTEYNEHNKCFYENILNDGICIFEQENNDLSDLFEKSIKLNRIE